MRCANDPALFNFEDNSTKEFIHSLTNFQRFYSPIHGRICVVLCLFGVFTNLIHCVVLTRPAMRTSAVNCLMTAVALCDMGTMASYLIYIIHFVLLNSPNSCSNPLTYCWMIFLIVHMFLSITLHTTTLWLAVAMALMRRMTLRETRLNSQWQKAQLAKRISLGTLGAVILLSIPTLMVHEIIEYQHERWHPPAGEECSHPSNYTETVFTIVIAQSALASGCAIFKTNLWLTGILFKVIPCVLLILLTSGLMLKLRSAEKGRQRALTSGDGTRPNETNKRNNRVIQSELELRDAKEKLKLSEERNAALEKSNADLREAITRITSDRTTVLLVSILIVFVLTEFPQGVLAILNAIYTTDVHRFIYLTLGDVLDLLSLMNSSVNFILYCLMSSRYRQTFLSLLILLSEKSKCISLVVPKTILGTRVQSGNVFSLQSPVTAGYPESGMPMRYRRCTTTRLKSSQNANGHQTTTAKPLEIDICASIHGNQSAGGGGRNDDSNMAEVVENLLADTDGSAGSLGKAGSMESVML